MITFLQYLTEANAAGSKFEQLIAKNMNKWLAKNEMADKFQAKRYQTVNEGRGSRDEDYSDIIVTNLDTDEQFFLECKEYQRANIINTQFDINEDYSLTPVKDKDRTKIDENETFGKFSKTISDNDEYRRFCEFLQNKNKYSGGYQMSDLYFGKEDVDDKFLKSLMKQYNKLVKGGKVEADCKEFDLGTIRKSTKNMLACALCWRLVDANHTWDICHVKDIDFFGDLIRHHYAAEKTIPAKYIQMNDHLFIFNKKDNPLGIDCSEFPKNLSGRFDLKFTPRFGTGACYVTPRSEINGKLESNSSFFDVKRFPKLI